MVDVSFTMLTLGVASALALILGVVGLYGILSYVVAERTREIGVRMALGAQAEQVRRMVVAQGSRVVLIGVLIGIAAASASRERSAACSLASRPLTRRRSRHVRVDGRGRPAGQLSAGSPRLEDRSDGVTAARVTARLLHRDAAGSDRIMQRPP